jgi:hypothetical protein
MWPIVLERPPADRPVVNSLAREAQGTRPRVAPRALRFSPAWGDRSVDSAENRSGVERRVERGGKAISLLINVDYQ